MKGKIPLGWSQTNLGNYITIKNGFAFKSKDYVDSDVDTVPVIRISDIQNKKATTNSAAHIKSKNVVNGFEVELGDLLIAMSGATTGKTGVFSDDITAYQNQRVGNIKLVVNTLGDNNFKNHLIHSLQQEVLKKAYGAAQPNISSKEIEEFEILLPPLNEQIRIANKLDSLLAKVDTAQARLEKIPTLLKRFRQSVLAAATSGELTREWRGDAEFGITVRIGDLTTDIRYGTSKKCSYDEGDIAVLRIPNIGDGKIDAGDLKFAYFDKDEKEKLSLKRGDILIIRSNGSVELVGKAALVSDKDNGYLFAGYLIRIRFSDDVQVVPKYILFCFQSPVVRNVVELNARSTSGINNINSKELAALEINLPSTVEQTEIVRRVESLFALADTVEKQYLAAKQRLDRLSQSLLAKAFRGELVPQDPNDEPAAELLKRIQAERQAQPAPKQKRSKPA
jgi:type I restriction enzyme S subunit